MQTQGQAQDKTRATRGHLKDKKGHMEDKPRTDLGQAEDKKDLRRAATEGKCNFTKNLIFPLHGIILSLVQWNFQDYMA